MAKRRFQGYAVGKGFSNIDPGFSSLTRLQEKQNQDLADLKQAEKERRNRDLQAEADLQRIMKSEEANRKEINIDQQAFSTRERALVNKRNQAVQNNNAELAKIKQQGGLLQIIGFSKQGFADYQTIQAKNWEATANESYQYHMNHGTSLEDQIRQDLLEDKQWSQSQDFEALADQLRAEGYTNQEVNYVRGKGNASDYGRLKAYSVKAGEGWSTFAQEQIARMGITDPVRQRQALEALRIKYLKEHKLYGLTSDFLEPMFQQMRKGTQSILDKSIHRQSVAFTQKRSAEALEVLATFKTPDSLNQFYLAKTREINPKTGTFFTPSEAKQLTFDELGNIDRYTDTEVENLLQNTKLLNQNSTWAKANQQQLFDLQDQRRIKRATREKNTAALVKQKKEEILRDKREFFKDPTRWNNDRRVGSKLMSEMKAQGFTDDELAEFLPYLDQSVQGRADGDQWRKIINDAAENGTLTTEDLASPWVPQDLKNKYIKQARENDALFATVDFKDVNQDLGGYLRASLKEFDLETSLHPSFFKAKRKAELIFRKEFKANGGDYLKAMEKVEKLIEIGKGDANNEGRGVFRVITADMLKPGMGTQSFFATFTPGSHKDAPKVLNTSDYIERDKIVAKAAADPTILDKELLIHPERLKEIATQIKEGKSYRLPEVFFEISKADPNVFGSPTDIWQRQLKAAVDKKLLEKMDLKVEDFRYTLFRDVADPTAQKMINNIRTKGEFLQTLQVVRNPSSTRDPRFMSNTVRRKLSVPSVLETVITREQMKADDDYEYKVEEFGLGDFISSGGYYV
mgnify:CR=1 FL=1